MNNEDQTYLLRAALGDMLNYYDRNACQHEDVYRGGAIWTICESCGKKWADDEGGFVPYIEPLFVSLARRIFDNN